MKTLRLAGQLLRGHARGHLLTMVTLLLGLVGIVTVAGASTTMARTIEHQTALESGQRATVTAYLYAKTGPADLQRLTAQLQRRMPERAAVAPVVRMPTLAIAAPQDLVETQVVLTTPALLAVRHWPVLAGAWLDDTPSLVPTGVANRAAAGLGADVGDLLRMDDGTGVVIRGVVDDGSRDPCVYVRLEQHADAIVLSDERTSTLTVSGPGVDPVAVRDVLTGIESVAGSALVERVERTDRLDELNAELTAATIAFLVVGTFSVLSLTVGILNIGLSRSRERAWELALRRALGMPRPALALAMVIESQVVAGIAAAAAIAVSVLAHPAMVSAMATLPDTAASSYPGDAALLGLGVGALAAAVGNVAPVARMWRLPMSTIMRL